MFVKFRGWLLDNWPFVSLGILFCTSLVFTYLVNLKNLVTADNRLETPAALAIDNLDSFIANISFAPTRALFAGVNFVSEDPVYKRLIAAITVMPAIWAFYALISIWHTRRIALFSSILFALSTYSLSLGRFSNTDVLYYVFIPLLIFLAVWLKSKRTVNRFLYIAPLVAIMLYLPGVLGLVIVFSIFFQRRIRLAWKFIDSRVKIISLSIASLLLVPLAYSLYAKPSQISVYLGIDNLTQLNFEAMLDRFQQFFLGLTYQGVDQPQRWLFGTPILDVATLVLIVLGIYSYIKGNHTLRMRLLLALFVFSLIFYVLGSAITFALVIPLIYIVAANGIAFMMQTWFKVFPKNPAARNTAVIAMIVLFSFISYYHVQRYFFAWPNSPETKSSLSIKN